MKIPHRLEARRSSFKDYSEYDMTLFLEEKGANFIRFGIIEQVSHVDLGIKSAIFGGK